MNELRKMQDVAELEKHRSLEEQRTRMLQEKTNEMMSVRKQLQTEKERAVNDVGPPPPLRPRPHLFVFLPIR